MSEAITKAISVLCDCRDALRECDRDGDYKLIGLIDDTCAALSQAGQGGQGGQGEVVTVAVDNLHSERRDGLTCFIWPAIQIGTKLYAAQPAPAVPAGWQFARDGRDAIVVSHPAVGVARATNPAPSGQGLMLYMLADDILADRQSLSAAPKPEQAKHSTAFAGVHVWMGEHQVLQHLTLAEIDRGACIENAAGKACAMLEQEIAATTAKQEGAAP